MACFLKVLLASKQASLLPLIEKHQRNLQGEATWHAVPGLSQRPKRASSAAAAGYICLENSEH